MTKYSETSLTGSRELECTDIDKVIMKLSDASNSVSLSSERRAGQAHTFTSIYPTKVNDTSADTVKGQFITLLKQYIYLDAVPVTLVL